MPDTYRVRVNFGITVEGGTEVERREFIEEYIEAIITSGIADTTESLFDEEDATGGGPVGPPDNHDDFAWRIKSIVKPRMVNQ